MNERRAELIYGQVLQRMDMTRETGTDPYDTGRSFRKRISAVE